MEFALPRSAGALLRLGAVSRDALRGLAVPGRAAAATGSRQALVALLEEVVTAAEELAQQVATSDDSQPLANAASICRWQLGRLRARAEAIATTGGNRGHRATVVHHLAVGMKAAQILSAGYRFHSLDRICRGGQALDDEFEALARLRVKLAALPE